MVIIIVFFIVVFGKPLSPWHQGLFLHPLYFNYYGLNKIIIFVFTF